MNAPRKRPTGGFSLLEMLITVAIIVILAGLTLGGFNWVERNKADNLARIQIGMLQLALEEYYADKGEYPDPSASGSPSRSLFNALYANSLSDPNEKTYLPELDPLNDQQGWLDGQEGVRDLKIVDPWGEEYQYRTGNNTVNPDFDLWSGGADGRTRATGAGYLETHPFNQDDIRGW